jgi:transposase
MAARCRDTAKAERWRGILRQWRRSGLSVREFCDWQNLSEPSLYAWRRELAERDGQIAAVPARIVAKSRRGPVSVRIFVYRGVTDMRRSFDRLAQMVEEHLEQNPESGHLYLFFNRRRDCVKMLLWEADVFVIWYKRLEIGSFAVPDLGATRVNGSSGDGVEIRARDLNLLLGGVDPARVTRRKRFERAPA